MGGYGAYVWPAFGVVAGLMAWLYGASQLGARRSEREVEALRSRRRGGELDP